MKKIVLAAGFAASALIAQAQEYRVITTIESVVPGGMGRSRIIENKEPAVDYTKFTTAREGGQDSKQSKVKRGDAKIENLEETKLLNFYSMVGINFQNIASNDAIISSKLNAVVKEGWKLAFVVSGVESDAGKQDGQGIFITRYVFEKK